MHSTGELMVALVLQLAQLVLQHTTQTSQARQHLERAVRSATRHCDSGLTRLTDALKHALYFLLPCG